MDLKFQRNQAWFREIKKLVEENLRHRTESIDDPTPRIEKEVAETNERIQGYTRSLGNPKLPDEVRSEIESEMEKLLELRSRLTDHLAELEYDKSARIIEISEADISERLDRLDEVLANSNPTLAHLELSLHIDRIDCFEDGTATVRYCKLGAAGQQVIASAASQKKLVEELLDDPDKCKPRLRARLATHSEFHDAEELDTLAMWAANPDRFANLEECWFDSVTFTVPEPTFWAKENAIAVAECRLQEFLTVEKLAERFQVTPPTIRKALKIAAEIDGKYKKLPRKIPRAKWHEEHAEEIHELKLNGISTQELATHYGKSDTTIRKAFNHAKAKRSA